MYFKYMALERACCKMAVKSLAGNEHNYAVGERCQKEITCVFIEEESGPVVDQDGSETRNNFGVSLHVSGNTEQGIRFNKAVEFTGLSESKVFGVQLQEFKLSRVSNDTYPVVVTDIKNSPLSMVDGKLKVGDSNNNSLIGLSTNEDRYISIDLLVSISTDSNNNSLTRLSTNENRYISLNFLVSLSSYFHVFNIVVYHFYMMSYMTMRNCDNPKILYSSIYG